jgi:hypothetical protein
MSFPPIRLHQPWPFGKYKGTDTDQLCGKDPRYVRWAIDNLDVELDDDAYKSLQWAEELRDTGKLPSERFFNE